MPRPFSIFPPFLSTNYQSAPLSLCVVFFLLFSDMGKKNHWHPDLFIQVFGFSYAVMLTNYNSFIYTSLHFMHGEVLLFKSKEIIMHLEQLKTLSPLSSPHLSRSVKREFTASNHSFILASLQMVINLSSPANNT